MKTNNQLYQCSLILTLALTLAANAAEAKHHKHNSTQPSSTENSAAGGVVGGTTGAVVTHTINKNRAPKHGLDADWEAVGEVFIKDDF